MILDRILAQERRLQFSIVEEGIPLTGKKLPKSSKKSKAKTQKEAPPSGPKKKGRYLNKRGRRR